MGRSSTWLVLKTDSPGSWSVKVYDETSSKRRERSQLELRSTLNRQLVSRPTPSKAFFFRFSFIPSTSFRERSGMVCDSAGLLLDHACFEYAQSLLFHRRSFINSKWSSGSRGLTLSLWNPAASISLHQQAKRSLKSREENSLIAVQRRNQLHDLALYSSRDWGPFHWVVEGIIYFPVPPIQFPFHL